MKTELRLKPHYVLPGPQIVEIWHDGKLIGTVTGADGPGVRIISKYFLEPQTIAPANPASIVEVLVHIR